MEGTENLIAEGISESIRFARVSERINAQIGQIKNSVEALVDLRDLDPELGPEVAVAAESLGEAADALMRAATFADARLSARIQAIGK